MSSSNFQRAEELFLAGAAQDITFLCSLPLEVYYPIVPSFPPTSKEFEATLAFIRYLYQKYGKHLHCYVYDPPPPEEYELTKPPEEIIQWLRAEFEAGKYAMALDYGVWFTLDEAVIPKEYFEGLGPLQEPEADSSPVRTLGEK